MNRFSVYDQSLKRWIASCPICGKKIRSVRPGVAFRSFAWHMTSCVKKANRNRPRFQRNESGRNRELIVHAIQKSGPISRSEIAEKTGLAKNTVINHSKTLLQSGRIKAEHVWLRGWIYTIPTTIEREKPCPIKTTTTIPPTTTGSATTVAKTAETP